MRRYLLRVCYKYPILQKSLVTILILSIYLLGTHITVPGVSKNYMIINDFLSQVSRVTGGNFNSITVFSLGLGPYMSSMILWKLITLQKIVDVEKMSESKVHIIQMIMVFIIALIQSLNIMLNIDIVKLNTLSNNTIKLIMTMTLIAGMFLLIWLCQINIKKGIGGMSIIILVNLLKDMTNQILNIISLKNYVLFGSIMILIVLTTVLSIAMENGEYRITINRTGIDTSDNDKTYLPIKANPSGGLSIMYTLTLFAIPQYLVSFLTLFFKPNTLLIWLQQNMTIQTGFGVSIYIIIMFFLTLGFGFFNVDPENIAEQLQKNGDYIEQIRPGRKTRRYLTTCVLRLSIIGAIGVTCLSSIPLVYGVMTNSLSTLYFLPGTILLSTGLFLVILEDIKVLTIEKKYKTILGTILHK